ncbi:unnamed protein product [Polarella glacialis]|uniref:Uncharacterized protein n=1 Tax=Polarella glacialis TaxID=89957 RepID=A0A813GXP4_POLGL|nr:unnamed protein product [Polarella glacialis]
MAAAGGQSTTPKLESPLGLSGGAEEDEQTVRHRALTATRSRSVRDPTNPQGWPPLADKLERAFCCLSTFDPELRESCLTVDEDNVVVSLKQHYRQGTIWLHGSLPTAGGGHNWRGGWRELNVQLTSPFERRGERLTGGLSVAFASAPPQSAIDMPPVHCVPNACGFTLQFLPKLLSLWGPNPGSGAQTATEPQNRRASPAAAAAAEAGAAQATAQSASVKHCAIHVCHGDLLRVLVSPSGWVDVVGRLASSEDGQWRSIVGWQTPLSMDRLFVGLTLRHTTAVTLRRVYHQGDSVPGQA